ncbi:pentatricopeptide repeat-containing protein At2g13600 [Cryptomeria japonica]|uniref:pentatricopeptide repeat-containing protein At2g13600 n=1 Tax=Cryptomeria japonica TaxID=3369 RepID=UPI0025AC825A|nr:pentatricopeptide repeat-containing protein At2g13600 [Cryptomeria japonica]
MFMYCRPALQRKPFQTVNKSSLTAVRGLKFAVNTFLQNTIINMYDTCGSIEDARKVFDDIDNPNVYSWNMIIAAYRSHGISQEAFKLFHQMQRTAVQPDNFTFSSILPVCGNVASLNHGFQIHGKIIRCRLQFDVIVMNALIDIYAKCGSVHKARELFDKMRNTDVVSWNSMITGYAQNGALDKALRLFEDMPQQNVVSWNAIMAGYEQNGLVDKALQIFKQMQLTSVKPNSATFVGILQSCAKMGALEQGMEIHQEIIESGFGSDIAVVTSLMDMYAKCGEVQQARRLFDKMHIADVISWNALIAGYVRNGLLEEALEIFMQMEFASVKPNSATFVNILPACAKMRALEQGMEIHRKVIAFGFTSHVVITALIDVYAKCGRVQMACKLFEKLNYPDVVSWNTMITGYVQNGVLDKALQLFKEMPQRDVISWTTIVAGYAQNGFCDKALEFFKQMQLTGVIPNSATFASVLPACAKMGALEQGMEIHQKIIESGFLSEIVATSLLDMYAKCGSIRKARELFNKMYQPSLVSWNAMIAGYGMHGYSEDALQTFEQMHSRSTPNPISLLCVLSACSHAGLVDDGCKYFNSMSEFYCITPTMDHYVCMVDLLSRSGYLVEALNFIFKMPVKPDLAVWMSLLSACRSHKNIWLGEFVASLLFQLDLQTSAPYVLLSNIYAEEGRWHDVHKVRELMNDRGITKTPGCSWIEVHEMVNAWG